MSPQWIAYRPSLTVIILLSSQQLSDNVHNAIRIHHALATKATDYTKKQYVFRLQTADQSEYLFQTSDSKELQSWIDIINFVCASFSAPPLEGENSIANVEFMCS